jgi:integrase
VARNLTCRHCQLPMFADTHNRRSTPRWEDVAFRFIPVGFHALRRGLNTVMKDLGIDYSLRADIMRHKPRNVTDKPYERASVTQMGSALKKVEAAYKKTK